MRIRDILQKPLVHADLQAEDKEEVLKELAAFVCDKDHLTAAGLPSQGLLPSAVCEALMHRERLGSTGVGEGVAIPHAKIPGLTTLIACFGRSLGGVQFDSIDQQPVHLLFVLLVPEHSAGAHLKALARISRVLKSKTFREHLLSLPDQDTIFNAFLREDA